MNESLLNVDRLNLFLTTTSSQIPLLQGVNFKINQGEILGLVGESGCGKSLTAQSVLRLLNPRYFKITGTIKFKGEDLLLLSERSLRQVRGSAIGLMSQDPSSALNPTLKIRTQLLEGFLKVNPGSSHKDANKVGIEWLDRMHIPNSLLRMQQYPHELSGGTKQRIALAMALICRPSLLLADEPTTALDVTVQAEILLLFKELVKEYALSILLITHDLGVVANCCDRVIVMRAGQIVETGTVDEIFFKPRHPYTQTLLQAKQNSIQYAK